MSQSEQDQVISELYSRISEIDEQKFNECVGSYQKLGKLSEDEYSGLKNLIEAQGVLQPVLVDEYSKVIDGHHRVTACRELRISCPVHIVRDKSEKEKEDMALSLNILRRNLSEEQKRAYFKDWYEKDLDGEQKPTQIEMAKKWGVSQATISGWLKNLAVVAASSSSSTR